MFELLLLLFGSFLVGIRGRGFFHDEVTNVANFGVASFTFVSFIVAVAKLSANSPPFLFSTPPLRCFYMHKSGNQRIFLAVTFQK